MRFEVVPDRLCEPVTETRLVRSSGPRRDPVDVAAELLARRFGPAEHHFEAAVPVERVAGEFEGRFVGQAQLSVPDHRLEVVG